MVSFSQQAAVLSDAFASYYCITLTCMDMALAVLQRKCSKAGHKKGISPLVGGKGEGHGLLEGCQHQAASIQL